MSDTTIAALLEKLREVDEDTFTEINFFSKGLQGFDITKNPNKLVKDDIIQGCILRAIAKRGWEYVVSYDREARQPYGQIGIPISNVRTEYQHRNYADTPAAAILAAYIEAKRESR